MSTYAKYAGGLGGGGSGGSGIQSINADTTAAQVIAAGSGITVATVAGTTTISNTASGGNVTGPVSSVAFDIAVFADTTGQLLADASLNLVSVKTPDPTSITLQPDDNSTSTNAASVFNITGATKTGAPATGTAGNILITGGTSTATAGQGGQVRVLGGAGNGAASGGAAQLLGGAAGVNGNGGQATITGGATVATATSGTAGAVVATGGASAQGSGNGGAMTLTSGAVSGTTTGASGAVNLKSGAASGTNNIGTGAVAIASGNVTTSTTASSGALTMSSGTVAGGSTGALTVNSGNNANTTGNAGALSLTTGNVSNAGSNGNVGALTLTAGTNAGSGTKGVINLNSNGANRVQIDGSGNTVLLNKNQLRFQDNSTNTIAMSAPSGVTTYAVILPAAQGGVNTFLENDGSGNLSWGAGGSTNSFSTIHPDTGTSPVASSGADTLNITSNIVDVDGNSGTKTIALKTKAQFSAGNSSTALTLNWQNGPAQSMTLTGNVTLTLTNPESGAAYVIEILTGAGSFTVTWPASVKWPGGTAPTITATASATDLINLYYDGTNYLGSFAQAFA